MYEQEHRSSTRTRAPLCFRLLAILLGAVLATSARASDQPTSSPTQPVLYLANGRISAGEIGLSTAPGILRWRAASAGSPSDFTWNEVSAIQWPPPARRPKPTGEFCFELAAGDVLFGSLVALDEKQAELEVPSLGRLHVQRSSLHRLHRWRDGADLIYRGPNGLAGWKEPAGQKNWREDSGRPMTDRDGVSIQGDFGIPGRASIEFELSWRSKADFVFALGVDDTENSVKRAFRFEAWAGDLIFQRETEREADLAVVQEIAPGAGRAHLQVYVDQREGRILVFSAGGKQLADVKARSTTPAALPGLYLWNVRGDVRLDWLRIGRWDGEMPSYVRAGQTHINRADGSKLDGQLTGWRAASKEFLFKTEKGETRISGNQFSSVVFPAPNDSAPRIVRAVHHDGSRISGEIVKVENGLLELTAPGIHEPLRVPLKDVRSLVVLRHETPHGKDDPTKR
jgi:hypothetical protein